MTGTVIALGTARAAGAPVEARDAIRVRAGKGVEDDRYGADEGTFRGYPDQEITLVEAEDAERVGIAPLELRRNVVTRGVSLPSLIGRTFAIGDVVLHGMRPCLPCRYLEGHLGKPGLKETLQGGLRARIVKGGEIHVGAAVEPREVTLDADMRAVVESAHLAFVATVTPDGRPNLSPKGTIRVLDERRLFFLDIASPQTRKDIAASPWMEVNVVDTTSRRGYRFFGQAKAHQNDDVHAEAEAQFVRSEGTTYENRGVVVLTLERALPLISPGYWTVHDEGEMRAGWKDRRAKLDAAFEAHVAARGPEPGLR